MNGRLRLLRDMAEYFEHKDATPTTTYAPYCKIPNLDENRAWINNPNKTIFFYHWSNVNKGSDTCYGIQAFVQKMKEYKIPTYEWQEEFIRSVNQQFIFCSCVPNRKDLIFRNTRMDLEKALNNYYQGKMG